MSESSNKKLLIWRGQLWQTWLPQVAVLIYLLTALAALTLAPVWGLQWMRTPFMGAFVEQTMVFNGAASSELPSQWSAQTQGLVFGYQLKEVNGQPVNTAAELTQVLQPLQAGQTVQLGVLTPQGQKEIRPAALIDLPVTDRLTFFYFPLIIGWVYLASAFWVFAIRRHLSSGKSYAIFAASIAIATATLFDLYTTHNLAWLWSIGVGMIGVGLIYLALTFPSRDPLLDRYPVLLPGALVVGGLLMLNTLSQLYDTANPSRYAAAWQAEYVFTGISLVLALLWMAVRRTRIASPMEREQIRLLLVACVVSFVPLMVWLVGSPVWINSVPFTPYLLLPVILFPIIVGYTIQRYRLRYADFVLSRAILYGLMGVLVTLGYALLVSGLSLVMMKLTIPTDAVFAGLVFFALALLFSPLRTRMERMIDAVFFRGQRAYQERLQTFSGELTRAVGLPEILTLTRQYVDQSLLPERVHLFVYDSLMEQYSASPDASKRPTSDLRFTANSLLVNSLSRNPAPLMLGSADEIPADLQSERNRIALLGAELYVPLPGRQRLMGWLALGSRLSGEPYSAKELNFLEALCDQASLAIERAQVVVNLENRVRETNVLSRIAQGVNITVALDDIMELIYAQTMQIIPTDDFHILLIEPETEELMEVFYLEKDERLAEYENKPVRGGQALEQEVIRQRKPMLTDDLSRECQRRNITLFKTQRVYSWMAVPLNAGAETIGALSLGSNNPATNYTTEQLTLLQAIADQAAGAIVKARLLQETERRARQLSTLNEVTRQLTSTLELEPLLNNILVSATEILNCQAGSLLMVDEQTDELVFKVTMGPVAGNLLNTRIPVGAGIAGKAVRTGKAVIVNNVQNSPDWFKWTDKQTGFVTQAILVIPLLVKEKVTGVIEVINKNDGLSFFREDQELLSAFAAQAAVAIENARLYTMTDQALAARVEELSVMQRIDRELNTSLEIGRAMRITLEWALRQSQAAAGLVGIVNEGGVKVMAFEGYHSELEPFNGFLPDDQFRLSDVIQSGTPLTVALGADGASGLLKDAAWQVILPIRRETDTIGLMLLESTTASKNQAEVLAFLQRLCDHAAIAISNAQLYAAVESANAAKSEFVSFVAHELKNPMTSIKGYTELLAVAAVGPVNEAQANFLATIRSNIDRMNTLVSDLNDLSKIEAGRMRLDFKAMAMASVVEEVVRSTRRQIEDKTQKLSLEIPADLPNIWADPSRVAQVLVNLVSNAHKYTPQNGLIVVSAEVVSNQWDASGAAKVVHLSVKDNGIGIAPEDQKKIFQKFFRSEDPKTREVPGTGLGLNITRALVEMQGGRIWFESEFRKGTTFHFTVPVAE